MNTKSRFRFVLTVVMLSPVLTSAAVVDDAVLPRGPAIVLAAANTGGSNAYASCMNGCWRSHRYCKQHQSGQMNCDHQLGQCIEWCESQHDPQRDGSTGRVFQAPGRSMVR